MSFTRVVISFLTVVTVNSCFAQVPTLDSTIAEIKSACDDRHLEYPILNVRWTKLCRLPSSRPGLPGGENPIGDSNALQIFSFKNRLRANHTALALEFEVVSHFGDRDSLRLSSAYSIVDGELRSVTPSNGHGAIYPQRSVLPPSTISSGTDQIAILSNYRPQTVVEIRHLLESIESYTIENGKWANRNAFVLKSSDVTSGELSYFLDVERPGHFLGKLYRSDDLSTEDHVEVFPATNGGRFTIQKIVHKKKISNMLVVDEVYQNFVYDFEGAPPANDLEVRFEPGMLISKSENGHSQVYIYRQSGDLELLNESNKKDLHPRQRARLQH